MDPLTHALTGAVLADALPMPKSGRRGLFFAMFMGASPDLDLVPAFIAKLPYNLVPGEILFDSKWMYLHRGLTHSLVFAVVFGLVAGWLFWRVGAREGSFWKWSGFAVLVLLSHDFLDLLNGGVRLCWPFSGGWVVLANWQIVDPLTLAPLLICFLANHSPTTLWKRRWREGTLEKTWRCFYERAGQRYGALKIAKYCLALIVTTIAIRLVHI